MTLPFGYVAASHRPTSAATSTRRSCSIRTRAAVAIGDVVGHSLHAAIVMGKLRHSLRAYAMDGYDPAEVLVASTA